MNGLSVWKGIYDNDGHIVGGVKLVHTLIKSYSLFLDHLNALDIRSFNNYRPFVIFESDVYDEVMIRATLESL